MRRSNSAHPGWALVIPLMIAGAGLGLLVSQLNNYTLSPISDERASEAAGVNSAARPLALQVALLVAILAGLPGLLNGFRMMRRPDPAQSDGAELALA